VALRPHRPQLKHIFPPEWFGDSVEILEAEIQKSLEGKGSTVFTSLAFDKLLRARQELCRLQGSDLPEEIIGQFGARIESVRRMATDKTLTSAALVPPGDAGRSFVARKLRTSKEQMLTWTSKRPATDEAVRFMEPEHFDIETQSEVEALAH